MGPNLHELNIFRSAEGKHERGLEYFPCKESPSAFSWPSVKPDLGTFDLWLLIRFTLAWDSQESQHTFPSDFATIKV